MLLSASVVLTNLQAVPASASVVIDFETRSADEIVTNQYAVNGVIFRPTVVVDYSSHPGFARGSKALQLCWGSEFCAVPLEMTFTAPQSLVRVWVGYANALVAPKKVIIQCYGDQGQPVGSATVVLPASASPVSITRSLEFQTAAPSIVRAVVGAVDPVTGGLGGTNDWVAIDDVEFSTQGPIAQPTRIHVTDDYTADVPGAEVFTDRELLGITDAAGILELPTTLAAGTGLIARQLVFQKTPRHTISYYVTSLPVLDDGSVHPHVTSYAPVQELRVSFLNTLIVYDLLVSLEWDASPAELALVGDDIVKASRHLYDASDGQILFGNVTVVDDHASWDNAEYQVFTDNKYHPNATRANYGGTRPGSAVHLGRNNHDDETMVHELGHYAFELGDEYDDRGSAYWCTPALFDDPGSEFSGGNPRSSCVMSCCAAKYCSNRFENPHVPGTEQSRSCWETIAEVHRDYIGSSLPTPRWLLKTPDTRGAIVGSINGGEFPVRGWWPNVALQNSVRPNLCEPTPFVVIASDGRWLPNRDIWLRTSYGATIFEGRTGKNGEPLLVTGLHAGDRVNERLWTIAECVPAAPPAAEWSDDATIAAGGKRGLPSLGEVPRAPIELVEPFAGGTTAILEAPPAFRVLIGVGVGTVPGQVVIEVRAVKVFERRSVRLREAPRVEFTLEGHEGARSIAMRYEAAADRFVGVVNGLGSEGARGSVAVEAFDASGNRVERIERLALVSLTDREGGPVFSADGAASVSVSAGGVPAGIRVCIGPAAVPDPPLPLGYVVVGGPVQFSSSAGSQLARSGLVRFALDLAIDLPGVAGVDSTTFRALRWDAVSGNWMDLGTGAFLPIIRLFGVSVQKLGAFALIAHRAPPREGPDVSDAVPTLESLWPPNGELVSVGVRGVRSSTGNGTVSIAITGVVSDEDVGKGGRCPDATVAVASVWLRAERDGNGNGRVYTVFFTASDPSGHANAGQVRICVPHDEGNPACVDDGLSFDATKACGGREASSVADLVPIANPAAPSKPIGHLQLSAGRPNPSLGAISFALELPGPTAVELSVYDVAGHRLWDAPGRTLPAGSSELVWPGTDRDGSPAPTGVYLVRIRAGDRTLTRRAVLVR